MAIPTMFHSSRLTEVNETTTTSGSECKKHPGVQTRALDELQTLDMKDDEILYISAEPRGCMHFKGGECQTFDVTSKEDSSVQSYISNRSLSDTSCTSVEEEKKATARSLRKHHRKHRMETKRVRKPRKTCRGPNDEQERFKSAGSKSRNDPMFSKLKVQDTQTPDPQNGQKVNLEDVHPSITCLCLHRLKLDFPSTIESHSVISDRVEPKSDSVYIYAESIKGFDSTCSTFLANSDTNNLNAVGDNSSGRGPVSVWNERLSQDSVNLYISSENKSSSGCSTEATAGSECYSNRFNTNTDDCDIDSNCIYTDWDRRHMSTVSGYRCSLAEAEWGSASSSYNSDSSCYTTDRDEESSYCTIDRRTYSSDPDGCVLEIPGVLPTNSIEKIHFESLAEHEEEFVPGCDDLTPDTVDACRDGEDEMNLKLNSELCPKLNLGELERGVIQTDLCHFSDIFCKRIKEATQEKVSENIPINEGFLFHPKQFLQGKSSKYREGLEYSVLRHIQNGSYGDVFSIRDKQTGFTCAAKKIPLCSFRWEEVETWSRLNGPHVLQLNGAVREGPNVMLFMDLKRGSLAQVLRMRGRISEGLALYYHSQVVRALEHLHSRCVVHLDVKADNVLLSEDGRQCYLCDFGLSETLNQGGYSTKTFRGNVLRGTESHMPPEVARGDRRSAKADVWSSCCMLLHMLNGHQPWTRYFPHPLYLKIVSESPPLWEIPPDCDPLTCDVIKAGLVKDPRDRHSASELLQKTLKALGTVCGLSGPGPNLTPTFEDWPKVCFYHNSHVSSNMATQKPPESLVKTTTPPVSEDLSAPKIHWVSTWRERAADEDDDDLDSTEKDSEEGEWSEDKMSHWMERYWGEENNDRNVEQIHADVNGDTGLEETDTAKVTISNQTRDWEDGKDAIERETYGMVDNLTEKRVVFRACGENCLLEEPERCDVQIRSFVDDEETDEEVESDLESLRELGNDWTQEEWEPFLQLQTLYLPKELHPQSDDTFSDSDEESVTLRKSEQKVANESNEPQNVTCDSEQDLSEEDSDDLSSGVFSSCSNTDAQGFNVDWSVSTNQTSSCYFEGLGVDIWVEDISGESLKIRERPHVKIGHVAVGISEQISMKVFSLATLDGRLVPPDMEVCESGMWLQCVPAPDGSSSWDWRVRDGKLELQEYDEHSDTCSTLPI
ncbi:uncharacterized protein map3k14b isoform X1 [Misgurnus anguillicaudatus]|uniref:uncharacterized protein map3k14b isoform X1 n=1 Tax=Misgurnus anguillicaudatus TaxID=75329 RepID=UPI003CCFD2D1